MRLTGKGFSPFDIRGIYPDDVNEEVAYRVGRSLVKLFHVERAAIGRDVRLSSPELLKYAIKGMQDAGADVMDIGMCGTEMIYFAVAHYKLDGGIMITASHNPKEYNGMKLVQRGSRPISNDSGLRDIRHEVLFGRFKPTGYSLRRISHMDIMEDYVNHLLTYVDVNKLRPYKVVLNAGNGAAGPVVDALSKYLPFDIVKINNEPDGSFPNGVPNPLLVENREATVEAVLREGADFGVAWDGDFDRCFLVDEKGEFIDGYYMVGLLAKSFLEKEPGAAIIYDPRCIWNTEEICREYSGRAVMSKSGHAFIKERMRAEDAIYGGEMSAHHYFRDFSYCDSGMIPWLLVSELMSTDGRPLSEMVGSMRRSYPISGEVNSKVKDVDAVLRRVEEKYQAMGAVIDHTDGVSAAFDKWRFNLSKSNTEPVIRLNVETRGDRRLMEEKRDELLKEIRR